MTGEGPGPENCSERLIVSLQWGTYLRQRRRVLHLGLVHPRDDAFFPSVWEPLSSTNNALSLTPVSAS